MVPRRLRGRVAAAAPIAAADLFTALAAAAATPADDSGAADATHRSPGRYCTPTSCSPSPGSPWSAAVGFGTAALACGWIARRRR